MTPADAFNLIVHRTAGIRLNRAGHEQLMQALSVLKPIVERASDPISSIRTDIMAAIPVNGDSQ